MQTSHNIQSEINNTCCAAVNAGNHVSCYQIHQKHISNWTELNVYTNGQLCHTILYRTGNTWGFPVNFKNDIPWLSLTVFGIISWPIWGASTSHTPTPFHNHYVLAALNVHFHFFQQKQQSHSSDNTHHFPLIINTIPRLSSSVGTLAWHSTACQAELVIWYSVSE